MKKLLITLALALVTTLAYSGPVKRIDLIKSSVPVKIEVIKDSVTNMRIKYNDDRLYDNVKYDLKDGVLSISALADEVYRVDPSDFMIRVTAPNDVKIESTGDMDIIERKTNKK